jgi:hypothetical protein
MLRCPGSPSFPEAQRCADVRSPCIPGVRRSSAERIPNDVLLGQAGSVRCQSCTVEMELSYLRLRATKPRVVWEISPMHGYTTLMILSALDSSYSSVRRTRGSKTNWAAPRFTLLRATATWRWLAFSSAISMY